jgi:hypothetical protein
VNLISKAELLLLLVTVLSQTLFALVGGHLMSFTLFSARHVRLRFRCVIESCLKAPVMYCSTSDLALWVCLPYSCILLEMQ